MHTIKTIGKFSSCCVVVAAVVVVTIDVVAVFVEILGKSQLCFKKFNWQNLVINTVKTKLKCLPYPNVNQDNTSDAYITR